MNQGKKIILVYQAVSAGLGAMGWEQRPKLS